MVVQCPVRVKSYHSEVIADLIQGPTMAASSLAGRNIVREDYEGSIHTEMLLTCSKTSNVSSYPNRFFGRLMSLALPLLSNALGLLSALSSAKYPLLSRTCQYCATYSCIMCGISLSWTRRMRRNFGRINCRWYVESYSKKPGRYANMPGTSPVLGILRE